MSTEPATTISHEFIDVIRGDRCLLVVDPTVTVFDGLTVAHDGCDVRGRATIELDAWGCTSCGRRGRVPGGWAYEMFLQAAG